MLAALAASVCCVGPLLLLALGVGGAWTSSLRVIEPYRPLFIPLTLGFLGFAFYRAHRRPVSAACNADGSCAVPRISRLNRVTLWVLTPIVLGLLAFPYVAPRLLREAEARTAEKDMDGAARTVLRVENLTCASCAAAARQSLLRVDGVKDAQVTAHPPVAIVTFDPARTSIEALTAATAKAGYPSSAQQPAAGAGCCDVATPRATPAAGLPAVPKKGAEPVNPEREVVFNVERLGCPLVSGVGCGHLLAPALADIDRIEGVSRSFANWTGSRLRVSAARVAEREAVAARVGDYLATQQYGPSRVETNELGKALEGEEWRSADRIHELSSFEFRTHARQRVEAFAQREGLEQVTTDKLLRMVDGLWQESGRGKGTPPSDEAGYPAYWNDRISTFKALLVNRAAVVLTEQQAARLAAEGER